MTEGHGSMDKALRDGRLVAAVMVWGAELERAGDHRARSLTPGLNFRDLLLLAVVFDHGGPVLPSELVGPVHTTGPGVSGSLRRLEKAGMVKRGTGTDLRTRPVTLTDDAQALAEAIVEPWAGFIESRLTKLEDDERDELYRLVTKASGQWDDVWG